MVRGTFLIRSLFADASHLNLKPPISTLLLSKPRSNGPKIWQLAICLRVTANNWVLWRKSLFQWWAQIFTEHNTVQTYLEPATGSMQQKCKGNMRRCNVSARQDGSRQYEDAIRWAFLHKNQVNTRYNIKVESKNSPKQNALKKDHELVYGSGKKKPNRNE